MQKGLIGILGVLVLFMAAANVRLSTRTRLLEEQLVTAARRPASPSDPLPTPGLAEPVPVPAPAAVKPSEPKRPDSGTPPVSVPQHPARVEEARLAELQRIKTLQGMTAPALGNTFQLAAPQDPDAGAGPRSGFLGILGVDVPGGGVEIQNVVPDSVALRSGLRPGDVLLEYNGEPIDTLATLTSRVRSGGEGAPVSLRLRRDGVEFYQGVQLGARAPAQR